MVRTYFPELTEARSPAAGPSLAKIGGAPWGFPRERWPRCATCGQAQRFLAQCPGGEHLPRLGAEESVYIFKCENETICDFWDPHSGCNQVFLLKHNELSPGYTQQPPVDYPDPEFGEYTVASWRVFEDPIPATREADFYDAEAFFALPEELAVPHDFDTNQSTKFGGAPYWTGNGVPAEIASNMRVLGQLNSWICTLEHPEDYVEIGNLCFDGIGYLYDQTPEASRPDLRFVISR